MAEYYRNFCLNFSEIAAPLANVLSKKIKFVWTDDCQLAFDKVRLLLQKCPFLKSPDYKKPFKLEKETLGLVLALDHFDVYLGSTPFKIKVCTDYYCLTLIKTMKKKNQRVVRWSLTLHEYNLEIQHIPGSENVVADALSRCIS